MAGLLSFFVFAMLLSAVHVFGATEYRLGGISGNDWQAVLTEESFFQIQDADGQPLRQVPVRISPFGARGPIRWSISPAQPSSPV